MNNIKFVFSIFLLLPWIPQLAFGFTTAPDNFLVGSNYSGHEEITRQALNRLSNRLENTEGAVLFQMADLNFDLQANPEGLAGYKSQNMIIHGNFASDFPKQTRVLSLARFWKNKRFGDFENPDNQVMHFLRNYVNSLTLESARATCEQSKVNIMHITFEALKLWDSGDRRRALFLLGHATHTIQDSFSPAHGSRGGRSENYDPMNICFFGNEMSNKIDTHWQKNPELKVCYHSAPDSDDSIWNDRSRRYHKTKSEWPSESIVRCDKHQEYPETEAQKQACLNHPSRLARLATEKFLFLVFQHLMVRDSVRLANLDFVRSLEKRLFSGPVGDAQLDRRMSKGILRCHRLSKRRIVGEEPRDDRN